MDHSAVRRAYVVFCIDQDIEPLLPATLEWIPFFPKSLFFNLDRLIVADLLAVVVNCRGRKLANCGSLFLCNVSDN